MNKLKNCRICLLRHNCRLREIVMENEYVFTYTLNLKSIDKYSYPYDSMANFCKLYVLDDVQELSLPKIE